MIDDLGHVLASDHVRRVLIYRLGSLGDTLIALPALHLIARAFPHAERHLLTNLPVAAKAPPAAAVLEHTGLVDGYIRYSAGTRNLPELLRLAVAIRGLNPDVLVYLAGARGIRAAQRDAKFFRLCGIRRQIGVPVNTAAQINFFGEEAPTPDADLEPEAARLVRNIRSLYQTLGAADLDDPALWDLHLTPAEHETAARAIGPQGLIQGDPARELLAVSVGTKVQAKDWGRDNWHALLTRLAVAYPNRTLLLAGSPEESDASDFAAADWIANGGGPVINLCGHLTPRESAAAFARARLFIGHDSGPMHLAAAVGTPCVAIFSARNIPRQWFPYGPHHRILYHRVECAGCGLETCIEQRKKCLLSITVDEVLAAIHSAMNDGAPRRRSS
ncbi:MAG TPA: glycosyltransferase family 9 protein [Candidatus Aquilonibacter sp.]|nr:glycosyltransferase family 9 protein [Candidatus Aquilonibacter sp.]